MTLPDTSAHPEPAADSTALVIGASDGIGLALTHRLLAEGWRVIGVSRRALELQHDLYVGAVLDVSAADYCQALMAVLARHGTPQLAIYCAGVGEPFATHGTRADVQTFQVNLVGAAATVEVLVPAWSQQGGGHLIGISSLADGSPSPEAPSYAASKAGLSAYLVGLGRALRARGIYVSSVRFGFVDTKMAKSPQKPFMISAERAAELVLSCRGRRPLQRTHPKRMALVMGLIAVWRWLVTRIN